MPAPDDDFLLPIYSLAKQSHDDDDISVIWNVKRNVHRLRKTHSLPINNRRNRARMPKRSEIGTSLASWAWQHDVNIDSIGICNIIGKSQLYGSRAKCGRKIVYIIWF